MSWKFVIRSGFNAGTSIDAVARWAVTTGYKFFLFNGDVYFIGILEEGIQEFKTGIIVEDLF